MVDWLLLTRKAELENKSHIAFTRKVLAVWLLFY